MLLLFVRTFIKINVIFPLNKKNAMFRKKNQLNFVGDSQHLNLVATSDLVLPDDVCEDVNPPGIQTMVAPAKCPVCPPCMANAGNSDQKPDWWNIFWIVVGISFIASCSSVISAGIKICVM